MPALVAAKRIAGRALALAPRGTSTSATAAAFTMMRPLVVEQAMQRRTFFSKEKSKSIYEYGSHRSNAEELISKVPIVEVDGTVALCDGGKTRF